MIFGTDRAALRQYLVSAWQRYQIGQPLQPLEHLIVDVIARHPEYHTDLQSSALERDYRPEFGQANPFLHLGMHIALSEQQATDRPAGIRLIYQQLCQQLGDVHDVEHRMMDILGVLLWEAQCHSQLPDEHLYLQRLQQLVKDS